jgi:predicted amidohydrolase
MFCPYPGLQERLGELAGLIDRMAAEVAEKYPGARLDIAALPEMAVSGGRSGTAAEVSSPLEGPVLDVMAAKAREHQCYVVVPLYLVDDREKGLYSNAAALLDRTGAVAGIYRKVFAVVDSSGETAEGGVTPGTHFPVFDCDFGRVGIQICYDMAFDEGWEVLRDKGAELIIWPSQWPGQIHPSSRALRGRCFILSSTWRNNASLLDPTGHVIREIREDGVFVEQIDLDYEILGWQSTLRHGAAFDEAFGARAGYRYSQAEDCGIFWSNDPAMPIAAMVRALDLKTKAEETGRARHALIGLRGGPPVSD